MDDQAEAVKARQCGRCRRSFPGDPMLHPVALQEWWLCEQCHEAMFGTPTGRPVTG